MFRLLLVAVSLAFALNAVMARTASPLIPMPHPMPNWTVAWYPDTRPAYPFANGVRQKKSTARALIGSSCNCSVRAVEGTRVYCAVDGRVDLVALCKRGPEIFRPRGPMQ